MYSLRLSKADNLIKLAKSRRIIYKFMISKQTDINDLNIIEDTVKNLNHAIIKNLICKIYDVHYPKKNINELFVLSLVKLDLDTTKKWKIYEILSSNSIYNLLEIITVEELFYIGW